MMMADVHIGLPLCGPFTYAVPDDYDIRPGMRVEVDLKGRKLHAAVVRIHDTIPENIKIKNIIKPIDDEPLFDSRLVDLVKDISEYYFCTPGEALFMALPSGIKPSSRHLKQYNDYWEKDTVLLNAAQKTIRDNILESYEKGNRGHLLFGVTGSGKTEVYINIADHFIQQGKSVIYLVPEISLSSQIFQRLCKVFGEQLVLYHSHLTANQRLYNWIRFFTGEAKIAVGTRSAVFMQAPDLGAVIIDEEHDSSYKENSTPRYSARRVAFYRSKEEHTLLLLGSATPSVETLYSAERGMFQLHRMDKRIGDRRLPEIQIIKINPNDPKKMVSPLLKLNTKKAMDEGRQSIYLLNRRGFAPFIICDHCSSVLECPSCKISLNFHGNNIMLCHYCGYKTVLSETCPECGSEKLLKVGSGTQRVEKLLADEFRDSRIFRLDSDSARKKNISGELLEKMVKGEIDILLGTQMVAKGFDFRNVVVVGVLLADIGLNIPDFRSAEKIMSLLMQVSGRCGRGDRPGRVIIQTIDDEHYLFGFLTKHDYYGFYRYELSMREALGYPPFSRLARLLVRGKNEDRVQQIIQDIHTTVLSCIKGEESMKILGPSRAPLEKIGNNYRHHLILKSRDKNLLARIIKSVKEVILPAGIYLEIDIDPYEFM